MSNPRHLFILLGFLAQGLTWDNYLLLAFVAVLWGLAAGPFAGRLKATLATEALALVFGCVLSILVTRLTGRSAHFFLGDGLILLQLVRMTRPLTRREKLTALIVASFHFAVLCTLAPNMRFVVLFLSAIFFFPGALKEVLAEGAIAPAQRRAFGIRLVPSLRVAFWLVLGSAFVFLTFPRFTGTPLQLREGFTDQGSIIDTILDPRRGGRANSMQVLMQIEGDNLGYMRAFALTETDGIVWRANTRHPLMRLPYYADSEVRDNPRYRHRRVFVKNSQFLGKMLPVDGRPVAIKRNFFEWPFENKFSGALECSSMWTTGNNIYEYWVDAQARPQDLQPDVRRHLLYHPPQSARLQQWLADASHLGTNDLQKARLLELNLRNQFTYKLGAPDLNRLAPVDDLIFNRKEGHCERFAAAMALFLRMQGIPSRVVVGYVAASRNIFTGRAQVRFRDAHSWTEGHFPGLGWVTFDATPGPPPGGGGSDIWDFMEAVDFAWYSHVVNFNGFAQKELMSRSVQLFGSISPGFWNGLVWVLLGVLVLALLARLNLFRPAAWKRLPRQRKDQLRARHYYEEMLHALEKDGLAKAPQQTPFEFLELLRASAPHAYSDAATVTRHFCRSHYGEKTLAPEEQMQARLAVARLKQEAETRHASHSHAQRSRT
jgi:transglutaminase-like putative cysteine protease